MKVKKLITNVNKSKGNNRKIEYIIVHYTGNDGDTAKANCEYFQYVNRNSSAHYFVDENEIYQCVEDSDIAWHSGKDYSNGRAEYWQPNMNDISIGVELCSKKVNGRFYIDEKTKDNAIELIKDLMAKYNIDSDHILRHFDVTWKECPQPFVANYDEWLEFKSRLADDEIVKALNILSNKGVIANTEFWKANYNKNECVKYVKDLIIKFANYIK